MVVLTGALASVASAVACQLECRKVLDCKGFVYEASTQGCQLKTSLDLPEVPSVGKELGRRFCGMIDRWEKLCQTSSHCF